MNLLFGGSIVYSIIGIAVGHIYIYLKDIYTVARGKDYLKTPRFV
jgi:Der1-like family